MKIKRKKQKRKYIDGWSINDQIHLMYRNGDKKAIEIIEGFDHFVYIKTSELSGKAAGIIRQFERKGTIRNSMLDPVNPEWTRLYIGFNDNYPYCCQLGTKIQRSKGLNAERRGAGMEIYEKLLDKCGVEVYEADVSPIDRYKIVNDITLEDNLSILYFDIETEDRAPDLFSTQGKYRIMAFSAYGSDGSKFYFDLGTKGILPFELEIKDRKKLTRDEENRLTNFDNKEIKLLRKMLKVMSSYDVCAAWNGANFDVPQIIGRTEYFGLRYPYEKIITLDHMLIFKAYHKKGGDESTSFSLQAIAEKVLGKGKVDKEEKSLSDLYVNHRELYRKYSQVDSQLLFELEEATGYIQTDLAICRIGNCFPRAKGVDAKIDGLLLKKGFKEGTHFPTRKHYQKGSDKITGAFVLEPVPGLHEGLINFDFASLYPSMMMTFNISPDVYVGKDRDAVKAKKIDLRDCIVVPLKGTYFLKNPIGYIPQLFRLTTDRRNVYKAEMKKHEVGTAEYKHFDRLAYAFKALGLSLYGDLANPHSRFYEPDVAESVTLASQYFCRTVMEEASRMKLKPIYGDTDSVFIQMPESGVNDFINHVQELFLKIVGECNQDPGRSVIQLEHEQTFERILFIKKKRYVGLLKFQKGVPSNAIEFKGLEVVRTDTLQITRQFQKQVYESILRKPERDESYYISLINRYRHMIYTGQIDIEQLILSKGVSKQPEAYTTKGPHIRVFEWIQRMGMEYYLGMKVPYYIVKPETVPRVAWEKEGDKFVRPSGTKMSVIHPSLLKSIDQLDIDHYWDKMIYAPIMRLLEKAFPDFVWEVFLSVEVRKRTRKFEQIENWFTKNIFEAQRKLTEKKVLEYYKRREDYYQLIQAGYFKGFPTLEKRIENFGTKVEQYEPEGVE